MKVSRNFSVSVESLIEIEKLIRIGKYRNASELVQEAIEEYLEGRLE